MSEQPFTAFLVFDPSGLQLTVSLPLACVGADDFGDAQAQSIRRAIEVMTRNGFTTHAPDAAEGEKIETVGYFCRRSKMDKNNGDEIAAIDVYPDSDNPEVKYKMITLYMNNDEDTQAFERATGLVVGDLPYYDGDAPLERTSAKAGKFLRRSPYKPLRIALTLNPAYDPEEKEMSKKKPRYKFSRWLPVEGGTNPPLSSGASTAPTAVSAGLDKTVGKIEPHWATDAEARRRIVAVFAEYDIHSSEEIVRSLGELEAGVTKLSESKSKSEAEYAAKIRLKYGKTWTAPTVAAFEAELTQDYPDIPAEAFLEALKQRAWGLKADQERAAVARVALEESWRVGVNRVSYHVGKGANDSYIVLPSALGDIRFYSTTKFAEAVGEGYARANGVGSWKTLKEARPIEPLVVAWHANTPEGGTPYLVADAVEALDPVLDQMLAGEIPY